MDIFIQILSFIIAEVAGVAVLINSDNSAEFILVYIFGVACGALGSRLASAWRQRIPKLTSE